MHQAPCPMLFYSSYFYTMLLLIVQLMLSIFCLPHGDLEKHIQELTDQIKLTPDSMELYMRRGELYLQHEDIELAKADFTFCIQHQFKNSRVLHGMANTLMQSGAPDGALYFIDKVISMEPGHLPSLELKSNILGKMGNYCEAAGTLEYVISLSPQSSPVIYIQCSNYWKLCPNEKSENRSVEVLKEGFEKLYNNTVIQNHLIQYYTDAGLYDEALTVYESLIEKIPFKARPYMQRAELYLKIGMPDNAKADFQSALEHIQLLPGKKRDLPAIKGMKEEITLLLGQLNP